MIRAAIFWVLMAGAAFAVEPGEMLDDPALEARARELSKGLRCLVCRNESIDESHAELARDLRVLVRERLVEGDSNEAVLDYVVARYGEYVLLKPRATGSSLILWIAGPLLLLGGLGVAFGYVRRQSRAVPAQLSDDEKARLTKLLNDGTQ